MRKFCGKGIFREIWKNRYVVLKGDQLYISEKEVGSVSVSFPIPPSSLCIRKAQPRPLQRSRARAAPRGLLLAGSGSVSAPTAILQTWETFSQRGDTTGFT